MNLVIIGAFAHLENDTIGPLLGDWRIWTKDLAWNLKGWGITIDLIKVRESWTKFMKAMVVLGALAWVWCHVMLFVHKYLWVEKEGMWIAIEWYLRYDHWPITPTGYGTKFVMEFIKTTW